jgi:asparagine N-glycosylation enzyme membrane subunit Stt3
MSGLQPGGEGRRGMTSRQARTLEFGIVGASLLALVMIFQPFSLDLFTLGAAAIVIVGLAFNLVPMAQPGKRWRSIVIGIVVIVVVFAIVTLLSLGMAELYGYYITPPAND